MSEIENIDEEIGATVARLRKQRGMTQTSLCSAMGLSSGQMSNLEAGKSAWTARHMVAMAKALGVTPALLFAGVGDVDIGLALADSERDLILALRKGDDIAAVRAVVAEISRKR